MFESVPPANNYIESFVIHDWEDGPALQILRCIRRVIPRTGTLFLVEHVVPERGGPSWAKMTDLRMLELGGLERTEREWRTLLGSARFT